MNLCIFNVNLGMKFFFKFLFIGFLLFSCKKETEVSELNYEYEYIPLEIGNYIVYKGDSILYNFFFNEVKRTSSFFVKETIKDTSRDNLNRLRYEISIQIRSDTLEPWGIEKIHYVLQNKKSFERVEDNLRYLKLIFPNKNADKWNAYKFIINKVPYINAIDSSINVTNVNTVIASKNTVYTNGIKTFDSTLTTSTIIDSSAISYFKLTEIYAKNIGLVYLERWNVVAKDPNANLSLPWTDRARLGFYVKLEAIDYGKN